MERLTATQVVIVGLTSRYRINGGWECGARGIEASRIDRVTPELEASLMRKSRIRFLEQIKWDAFTDDALASIASAVKSAAKITPASMAIDVINKAQS